MSLNKKIILSISFIVLIAAGAYIAEYAFKEHGLKSASMIKVTLNNKDAAYMDMDLLAGLKKQEVTTDDDQLKGPELLSVLTASGVGEFSSVEIKGLNSKNVFRTQKSAITSDFVLNFTQRGTVDLYQGSNPKPLVEDVAVINVTK